MAEGLPGELVLLRGHFWKTSALIVDGAPHRVSKVRWGRSPGLNVSGVERRDGGNISSAYLFSQWLLILNKENLSFISIL